MFAEQVGKVISHERKLMIKRVKALKSPLYQFRTNGEHYYYNLAIENAVAAIKKLEE